MRTFKKIAVLLACLTATGAMLAPAASAAPVATSTGERFIGNYGSSEACGRASVNYVPYGGTYRCSNNGYNWALYVRGPVTQTPAPTPTVTTPAPASNPITHRAVAGYYSSAEACGRSSVNRATTYWTGYECTQSGSQWKLTLTHRGTVDSSQTVVVNPPAATAPAVVKPPTVTTPQPGPFVETGSRVFVGNYGSSEACGRDLFSKKTTYWNGYTCNASGSLYQGYLTHTEPVAPAAPAKKWTVTHSQTAGTFGSGEACGRTGYSKKTSYWNGYYCSSNWGSNYTLTMTHSEWV